MYIKFYTFWKKLDPYSLSISEIIHLKIGGYFSP